MLWSEDNLEMNRCDMSPEGQIQINVGEWQKAITAVMWFRKTLKDKVGSNLQGNWTMWLNAENIPTLPWRFFLDSPAPSGRHSCFIKHNSTHDYTWQVIEIKKKRTKSELQYADYLARTHTGELCRSSAGKPHCVQSAHFSISTDTWFKSHLVGSRILWHLTSQLLFQYCYILIEMFSLLSQKETYIVRLKPWYKGFW